MTHDRALLIRYEKYHRQVHIQKFL